MKLSSVVTLLASALSIPRTDARRVTHPTNVPKNAVLLSKIASLTLRSGKLTAARRVSAVLQTKCVGDADVCKLYKPDVIRCTNDGADYDAENIQWSCKASLPEEFKLGSTDVTCEGYESSDDPYVLKGSCGVEYRLLLTEKGEEKFGRVSEPLRNMVFGGKGDEISTGGTIFSYLFMALFLAVLGVIMVSVVRSYLKPTNPDGTRRDNWGGGGGGGGGHDDPPPPYDYSDRPPPAKKPSTRSYAPRASSSRTGQSEAWRPGFWTGSAAGAAAGYMAGRQQTQTRADPAPGVRETRQTGGGLFGSGWGGTNTASSSRNGGPASSPASGSSTSFSGARHESTGFGSTTRR